MVGLIVTGHGHFATGLTSSVDLIAGPQPSSGPLLITGISNS